MLLSNKICVMLLFIRATSTGTTIDSSSTCARCYSVVHGTRVPVLSILEAAGANAAAEAHYHGISRDFLWVHVVDVEDYELNELSLFLSRYKTVAEMKSGNLAFHRTINEEEND